MRLQALMSSTNGWSVFVPLLGSVADWPEHVWPDATAVPTPAQRAAALAALGYEVEPGAVWEWQESTTPDEPDGPVELIAAASVRPLTGEVDA